IGWVFGIDKLRIYINENSTLTLGRWFNYLIKYISPAILALILIWNLVNEFTSPLYGSGYSIPGWSWISYVVPLFWIVTTLIAAYYLTFHRSYDDSPAQLSESKLSSQTSKVN